MESSKQLVEKFNFKTTNNLFSPWNFRDELMELLRELSELGFFINIKISGNGDALVNVGTMPQDEKFEKAIILSPSNCKCVFSYGLREDLKGQPHLLEDFDHNVLPLLRQGIEQIYGRRIDGKIFTPRYDRVEEKNIERTIQGARYDLPVALVALDLDEFKKFNKKGEDIGDRAIKLVGSCLSEICQRHKDVFFYRSHIGGDEFLILMLGKSQVEVLKILLEIQDGIAELHLEGIEVPFGASCGLVMFPSDAELQICKLNVQPEVAQSWRGSPTHKRFGSFEHYYFLADQALIMKHGEPKGRLRIPKGGIYRYKYFHEREPTTYEPTVESLLISDNDLPFLISSCKEFSFILTESNDLSMSFEYIVAKLTKANTVKDLWSHFLESLAQLSVSLDSVEGLLWVRALEVGKISWPVTLSLFVACVNYALFYCPNFKKKYGEIAINFVLRQYDKRRKILSLEAWMPCTSSFQFPMDLSVHRKMEKWKIEKKLQISFYVDEKRDKRNILKYNTSIQNLPQSGDIKVRNILSPVLLLVIGKEPVLPVNLKAVPSAICYLDDRPTIGGGLPDPWQSNVSKIVYYVVANPNVRFLLFYGDIESSKRTWEICDKAQSMSILTRCESFINNKLLERFSKQIKNVENCRTLDELRKTLPLFLSPELKDILGLSESKFYIDEGSIKEEPIQPEAEPEEDRIFVRDIDLKNYLLDQTQGLVFEDLKHAYPAVIDLLRNLDSDMLYKDQIGRQMRELRGFKLIFTNPIPPTIPTFFVRTRSEKEFKAYYERVFDSDNGIFGKRIYKYPTTKKAPFNQYNRQVDYIYEQIKKNFATRRAGMQIAAPFIDWDVHAGKELPLGLISIAMLPRFNENKNIWELHYYFNWRTVEAIVGFPFSAFASCQFAQQFTSDLQKRLRDKIFIETGELVYNAVSLHLFEDRFEQFIARKIVEQVTK